MPIIEFQSKVRLHESIVIASRSNPSYPPIQLTLADGTTASVSLVLDLEDINRLDEPDKTDWTVVTPVNLLEITMVRETDVSDIDRLHNRHPTERRFTIDGVQRQIAEALGERIADQVCEAANVVVRYVCDSYGQFWLEPVEHHGAPGNFLRDCDAQWREPDDGTWRPLRIIPTVNVGSLTLGGYRSYLEEHDWRLIANAIASEKEPVIGLGLLADARRRYEGNDVKVAVFQLNLALEWAASTFVEQKLEGQIPDASLNEVLRQSYARLLEKWVLPLAREKLPELTEADWEAIQTIRKHRRSGTHPAAEEETDLTSVQFLALFRSAARTLAMLVGIPTPKTPPCLNSDAAAGSG